MQRAMTCPLHSSVRCYQLLPVRCGARRHARSAVGLRRHVAHARKRLRCSRLRLRRLGGRRGRGLVDARIVQAVENRAQHQGDADREPRDLAAPRPAFRKLGIDLQLVIEALRTLSIFTAETGPIEWSIELWAIRISWNAFICHEWVPPLVLDNRGGRPMFRGIVKLWPRIPACQAGTRVETEQRSDYPERDVSTIDFSRAGASPQQFLSPLGVTTEDEHRSGCEASCKISNCFDVFGFPRGIFPNTNVSRPGARSMAAGSPTSISSPLARRRSRPTSRSICCQTSASPPARGRLRITTRRGSWPDAAGISS